MPLLRALLYLRLTTVRNIALSRLRRLKQPKYLIGAIFGLLYIFYLFGIRIAAGFASSQHRGGAGTVTPENAQMFEAVGALILFFLVFLGWVFGRERASLIFSEAEVAFLFPAPVSRRKLIHYKLIKSQVTILFTVLVLTIIFGRFWSGGMAWVRSLGWWVILTTLNLHIIAASFAREKTPGARHIELEMADGRADAGRRGGSWCFSVGKTDHSAAGRRAHEAGDRFRILF